jgi:hypothetical protein
MSGYTQFDANGQLLAEKEPLLQKPLNKPWKEYDEFGNPVVGNYWTLIFGSFKHMLIHAAMFAFWCMAFMLGYHVISDLLLLVVGLMVLAMVGMSLIVMQDRRKFMAEKEAAENATVILNEETKRRKANTVMQRSLVTVKSLTPLICAASLIAGSVSGMSINMSELSDYWAYDQYRHYTNVDPSEPAASHSDASVLVFMHGARPDGSRSMGYTRYGATYCVAPIALEAGYSGDQPILSDIQYWAVGKDCCSGNEGFACEGAREKNARTGLVKVNRTRRESSEWAPSQHEYIREILSAEYEEMTYYEKAVLMTQAKFGVTSPEERLFVRFVDDIGEARDHMWGRAWWSWFEYCGMFWLFAIPAGIITIAIGAVDPDDSKAYTAHLTDMKTNVLHGMNNII